MATFWPEGLCNAELLNVSITGLGHGKYLETMGIPYNAVCALSYDILDVVLIGDIEGYFS